MIRRHIGVTAVMLLGTWLRMSPRAAGRHVEDAAAQKNSGGLNAVPYFIADGAGLTAYRASDRELAQWALYAWVRAAGAGLDLVGASEPEARIRIYWAGAGGSE